MLRVSVYRHRRVMEVMDRAETVVRKLFARYLEDPAAMPEGWRPASGDDETTRARRIADFLAGMTDRYAIAAYERLYGESSGLG
jgi:dGTPase